MACPPGILVQYSRIIADICCVSSHKFTIQRLSLPIYGAQYRVLKCVQLFPMLREKEMKHSKCSVTELAGKQKQNTYMHIS